MSSTATAITAVVLPRPPRLNPVAVGITGEPSATRGLPIRAALREMKESRISPGVLYRTVLLAFGLVVLGLVFRQLITLVLAVLIVVIIATPLSAFATFLQRFRIPRGVGAPLGLLVGLAAIGGLVYSVVPVFSHEVNQF